MISATSRAPLKSKSDKQRIIEMDETKFLIAQREIDQENQIESMIEEIRFDIENGKISKTEGNKKIAVCKNAL